MRFIYKTNRELLEDFFEETAKTIEAAKEGAVQDAARMAVREGRANIAAARFSTRWRLGLVSKFYPNKGTGDPAAIVFHRVGFASVFEHGATIGGHPLLWLPIKPNLPSGIRSPRKYGRKLVSVNVTGKPPMLFDAQDRRRGPLFFGVPSVTLQKRWNLTRVFARVLERLDDFYERRIDRD